MAEIGLPLIDKESTKAGGWLPHWRLTFEPFLSVKNDDLGNYYQSARKNDWVDY